MGNTGIMGNEGYMCSVLRCRNSSSFIYTYQNDCILNAERLKGIVSVYIAKFSNGSRKGIPNKQSSVWVSHFVTSGSSEYSIATKHAQ